MFVIMPISVMGVYGFIAMPSFIAVNGDYSWLFTQTLGLITIALGIVTFAAILHLVLQRQPFDFAYSPAAEGGVKRNADRPASVSSVNPKLRTTVLIAACSHRAQHGRSSGSASVVILIRLGNPDHVCWGHPTGQTPSSGPMLRR
jgi:hypothetical protein